MHEATLQLSPGVLLLANSLWPEESINMNIIIGKTIWANESGDLYINDWISIKLTMQILRG